MKVPEKRLAEVRSRITEACRRSGRDPGSVRLLAVSKQQEADALRALHGLGQRAFGENRVQEALEKQNQLLDLDLEWHFIGPIQSNKTRDIATHFDWVHSVDRLKILKRLDAQRPGDLPPLQLCLQVNIDDEPQKAGARPDTLSGLAEAARNMDGIRLRGLMCLPALTEDEDRTRKSFRRLANLADELRAEGHALDTLSMGMSGDLDIAIECGSTLVRVGTDLFGPRHA